MAQSTYTVVCTDCQWEAVFPTRETAEHARRAHRRSHGHHVAIDEVE